MKPGFFEPGMLYHQISQNPNGGHSVIAHFRCLGVGPHPDSGAVVAVGHWRMIWSSGRIDRWEISERSQNSWNFHAWVPVGEIV